MRGPLLWHVGRTVVPPILRLVLRLRCTGRENVPDAGPTLVVCNHVSMRDPPLVGAVVLPRRGRFMAKSELFRNRLFGWLIRDLGAFPVVRGGADRAAIRTARELLAGGELVVMFPEGTRSRDGVLRPGFPGAGLLAMEPGVTVVPAAIWGSQHRFGPVRVAFGPPIDLSDLAAAPGPRGRRVQQATGRIMAAIAALIPAAGGPVTPVPVGEPSFPQR